MKHLPEPVHSLDVLVLRKNRRSTLKLLKLLLMAPRAHNLTFKGLQRPPRMSLALLMSEMKVNSQKSKLIARWEPSAQCWLPSP